MSASVLALEFMFDRSSVLLGIQPYLQGTSENLFETNVWFSRHISIPSDLSRLLNGHRWT